MRYVMTVLLMTGCSIPLAFSTPPGEPYELKTYPLEIEYELLDSTTGEACLYANDLDSTKDYKSADPRGIGRGVLFERAKFVAIEKVHGADGITSIRSRVFMQGGAECTVVTGRAYRIKSMRATPEFQTRTNPE